MTRQLAQFVVVAASFVICICCSGGSDETSPANTPAKTNTDRGNDIMAEFLKRDAAPFRKDRVRFTINEEGSDQKVYEIETTRRQQPDETRTLTEIVSPPEESGLGSLVIEAKDKPATVTTYSVSRGDFRETGTEKTFFGGLSAGELLGEWDKFDYHLTDEKSTPSGDVYEIEGKLKQGATSAASRLTAVVAKDTLLPVELHFFDASGQEIRTYRVTEIKKAGGRPYPARTEVDNPVYHAHIVIEILKREFPANVDDQTFERDKLKQIVKK